MAWRPSALFEVLAVTLVLALGFGALFFWRRLQDRRRATREMDWLHKAIDEVDIFGQGLPHIDSQGNHRYETLVERINDLLNRVHRYKQKLTARDRRLRRVLSNVNDVLYQTNADGVVLWITDSVEHVLGYRPDEIRGRRFDELLVREDRHPSRDHDGEVSQFSVRAYRRDGSIAWLLLTVRYLTDAEGKPVGSEAICRDGTDLIAAEEALFRERKRAQVTLASIGDGVVTTDTHGRVDYMNPAAETLTGFTRAACSGKSLDRVCQLIDMQERASLSSVAADCMRTGNQIWLRRNVVLQRSADGKESVVEVSVAPIRDSRQEVTGAVVVLHDITQISEMTHRMYHQATHDALTGLPNRQVFEESLSGLLERARQNDEHHGLCYIDLDQFKLINDTCGHAAGDELLRQITNELSLAIGEEDTLARLGGDEFGVLLQHSTLDHSRALAEKLRSRVEDFRFGWQNKLFRISASIGLVEISRQSVCASSLMSSADAACYMAKEGGRNRVHAHSEGQEEMARWHNDMERVREIRHALDSDGFELHGQVIRSVDHHPGDPISVELLVRMRSADGLVQPQDFLPIADRYQLMPEIDRWVLNRALSMISRGGANLGRVRYFTINLSGQSMSDDLFSDFVIDRIRNSGLDPQRLVFEITETSAVTNLNRAVALMQRLRGMGCLFALDDFGSGLTSFSYLKQLPLDFLKIDGTFVRNICSDPVDLETVKSINQVGHAMGLITVAEYVSDRQILEALCAIGVDYVQGFYLGEPQPLHEVLEVAFSAPPPKASRA